MIQSHMSPLDSIEGSHSFFFQFWPPGAPWFPVKSVVGVGVMINQKNVVGIIFFSLFQLLNVILDQFVDCKLCIVMHYQFTDHKLVQNYI